jgi:UDP-glucose 4-epimerase
LKLLVTGGAGYVGSIVASQLVEAGHETVVLDDLSKGLGTHYPTRDGTAIRDYIHIEDLGRVHLPALEAPEPGEHRVYDLGNGSGFSVLEVVEAARKVTGVDIRADEAPRRAGDPPELVASSEKIKTGLAWKPEKPELEAMISDAWDWMQDHSGGYE